MVTMSNQSQYIKVERDAIHEFVKNTFETTGLSNDHATVFANNLIDANLRGKESHGLIRLPDYIRRIQSGGMNTTPDVIIKETSPSVAIVNGDNGPGQVVSTLALEKAIQLATSQGVGLVGIKNSNHFGTVSYYTNQAATNGHIGIGMTHGGPIVAPYGAMDRYFSTNPISVAAPHRPFPVNVDISTSATALGNILLAEKNDEAIPPAWALDESGTPTTDPTDFHALRPMAEHKGYGLAFAIDILCGVLVSGQFGSTVSGLYDDIASPQELAHMFILIDIESFVSIDVFRERIAELVTEIKRLPVREGANINEVYVPGERSHLRKQKRLEDGIPIRETVWTELKELADEFGLQLPDVYNIDR